MKKLLAIISALMLCMSLVACGGTSLADKYRTAQSHLDEKRYEEAISLFKELAAEGYEDSQSKVNEAKFAYAKANNNNDDEKTYEYLKELVEIDYTGAKAFYDELYSWKANIFFNDSQNGKSDMSTVKASTKTFPFYFIHFQISGGTPGAEYHGEYEIKYSNGMTSRDGYYGRDSDLTFSITCSATQSPIGRTTFTLYDENGAVIATKSAIIK